MNFLSVTVFCVILNITIENKEIFNRKTWIIGNKKLSLIDNHNFPTSVAQFLYRNYVTH